ncbi:MAG: hypothetical protein Q4G59_00300 [Planctomycetia bacterium]|nr:hypothetical protein [Planctomycetia bacterium]
MTTEVRRNEHLVFKSDDNGCRSAITDDASVIHLYAVITPEIKGDAMTQIESAIRRLDTLLRSENMLEAVVNQTVFLREIGDKQLVRQLMMEYYGENLPAITYVAQTPCDGSAVIVEIHAIASKTVPVEIKRLEETCVSVSYAGTSFDFVGDLVSDPWPIGSYARSYNVFEHMKERLGRGGFAMADLLRTWIYQGHIVLREGDTQRYKELNRARTDFFAGIDFIKKLLPPAKRGYVCPASTGIGADDVDVAMTAFAIQTDRNDVIAVPLENPGQTPAFDYGEYYSPQSPKFARAMAYSFDGHCTILVSGTASITDSETRFVGDPAGQANQTLDNIAMLIAGDNTTSHGVPGFDADLKDMVVARVYVKRPEYYDAIRAVCEKRFGDSPIVYTFADVCRDDLLVEMEGIASCQRGK